MSLSFLPETELLEMNMIDCLTKYLKNTLAFNNIFGVPNKVVWNGKKKLLEKKEVAILRS